MDIQIKKSKTPVRLKQFVFVIFAVIAIYQVADYLWFVSQADAVFKRDTLVLGEVKRGPFSVSVRGAGVLVPDNVHWLSASVEAKVVRRAVKAGNKVKAGDLIVELSNPQLVQRLAEATWELAALEAEANAAKVVRDSALLEQKALTLNAKLYYERSLLENTMQTDLLQQSEGAVSKLNYQRTRLETDQFKQRWKISQERLEKMQENVLAQNAASDARVNKAKNIRHRIQQQVDELTVRASMDSIVLDMPLEPGQSITVGANIAKLAEQGSLIAELQIPEIQIGEVQVGQAVVIDTRNHIAQGHVSRIDPAVVNGNVQVDVAFTSDLPADARPDLSVDGVIKIAVIEETLFVERPLFAQAQSDAFLYALTEDGQFAERVAVKIGLGSVGQVQVLQGLRVGDRIVTSDPTKFETYQKFRIN